MKLLQFCRRQTKRQRAGIPHLQAVTEEHDLNAAVAAIVTVRHSIDDGLGDSFNGNFIIYFSDGRIMSGCDMGINVRQDKSDGLVYHLKNTPVKDLIRKNRFGHFVRRKHGAFHFGSDKKLLRVISEQQQSRIGKFTRFRSQVEMSQYLRNVFGRVWDGKVTFRFGQIDKEPNLFRVDIVHRGLMVEGGVEWQQTKVFFLFKIPNQRSIYRTSQLFVIRERLPDHLLLGFGNKGFFFHMT